MTLNELYSNYNFHDSNIEEINLNKADSTLLLKINFAFWMQKDYVDGTRENGLLTLMFHGIKRYQCDGGNPINPFVGILDTSVSGNCFTFNLLDDENNSFIQLKIWATDVDTWE